MINWLFPDIRRSEENRFRYFLILAALLFASQSSAMTVCESLLLSRLGIQALPYSVLLASGLTMLSSYFYTRWVGRKRHEDSLLILIGIAVIIILGSIPFVLAKSKIAYVAIFGFHFVTFTIFAGHLQALAGDYFDTLASKRVLPLIGVGATLGEIVGGLSSSGVTRFLPIEALLGLWAFFLTGAAAHTLRYRDRLKIWNPSTQDFQRTRSEEKAPLSVVKLLKSSSLNLSLLGLVCFMILTMSMVQYVVSDVFVTSFPDENKLAAFFGIFVACSNGLELLIASKMTPKLLRQFGVARCNTLHAFGAFITLALLWKSYALVPAMLAWMNRKTLHDALAGPVRRLVFNAVDHRQRVRLMAFIDGVAGSAARAAASLGIFVLQGQWSAKTFVIPGLIFACGYIASAISVGRHYFQALVSEIAEGKIASGQAEPEPEQIPLLWTGSLKNPVISDLKRLAELADHSGYEGLLFEALEDSDPAVQVVVIEQLQERCPDTCLRHPDNSVRLAAAKAIWPDSKRLSKLLDDPDPQIQELAGAATGRRPVDESALSVRYAHSDLISDVVARLQSDREELQVAALRRLAGVEGVCLSSIFEKTLHNSQLVAEAAVESLAKSTDPMAIVLLTRCLEAEEPKLRLTASRSLASIGESILPHLSPYFRAERLAVAEAAYDALEGQEGAQTKELLGQELRTWVREAWRNLVLHNSVHNLEQDDLEFLELALSDRADRCQRLAFKVLALLEGEHVVGSVVSSLRFSDGAKRASALEVLSNLGDREAAGLLVLLTEPTPLAERLNQALSQSQSLAALPHQRAELLLQCLQSPGRFVTLGVVTARNPEPRRMVQNLLTLRRFELFSGLTLEELEEVADIAREERFAVGEKILSPNSPARRIYLSIDGQVSGVEDKMFGVVSALDEGAPLEQVVAETNCKLFSLSSDDLFPMIRRQPTVAFPLIEALTGRLKRKEDALAR